MYNKNATIKQHLIVIVHIVFGGHFLNVIYILVHKTIVVNVKFTKSNKRHLSAILLQL